MSQPVKLSDIEEVKIEHLKTGKLEALERGDRPDGPILLNTAFGKPYKIRDGRHRIYLARQKGQSLIEAELT